MKRFHVLGGLLSLLLGVALAQAHDPANPAQFSRLPQGYAVRFQAPAEAVREASLLQEGRVWPMARQLVFAGQEVWRGLLPEAAPYRIRLRTQGGERVLGPFQPPARPFQALPWVGERVGYQVFPDRFQNGDAGNDALALESDEYRFNQVWQEGGGPRPHLARWEDPPSPLHCCHQYYGGDLKGLLERLPYLAELGVGLLYLNPIFLSGSVHGYDTHDYLQVAPRLGDEALLRGVLERAHALGIRVLFDFVPNHTGLGFFAFQDVVRRGRASPYWGWYFIRRYPFKPGDATAYEAWWGVGSLPKLNTGNPEVRAYLYRVAEHWVRFGFDGVRVDVPEDLLEAKAFFRELKGRLRALNPEVYLVGEIWRRAPDWVGEEAFDSLMNYALGRDIVLRYAQGLHPALFGGPRALAQLAEAYALYPEAASAMGFNLISSHDTSRLLSDLGGDVARARLAWALLFALPGAPVVWQGEECALQGAKEPLDLQRQPIPWEACQGEMRAFIQGLARLKAREPALRGGYLATHLAEGGMLSFWRGEGEERLLLAFNNQKAPALLPLPQGTWEDLLTGSRFQGQVEVPGVGARYLKRASR
ncbi:alpha-amylase family glycosyl hydrolase [Thermus igniterrae]|jgi:cyclomaltodextrinase|uniref:alpha-amylase family glycosyl hydrolase n=1 Tax=Thermus igniterrae TaxID=88189 RepID=UPI000374255C|nr:alpha-amylase family glycosyl hydrolase [Thermus igniterrae]